LLFTHTPAKYRFVFRILATVVVFTRVIYRLQFFAKSGAVPLHSLNDFVLATCQECGFIRNECGMWHVDWKKKPHMSGMQLSQADFMLRLLQSNF